MRRCLIIASVAIFGFLISTFQTSPTFEVGSAWASGGDGGGRDSVDSNNPDDQPSGKKKKATKKKAPRKKKAKISIANDYPQSRIRDIRDFQNWIATHAKKDNLRWIATNEKQLKKFVLGYEKFKNKYRLLKALEVNKIFTQLKKYAKQKENKELAAYAKGMLHAFNVYDHLRYARGKYDDWKKAPKGFKKELAKRDYEEAQDDYYKSRSKLPRRMIMSFPVIKDIR
ncbi:MAG: hypothetical protein V7761_04135 [Amylibacter sp.]